jgi:hypothetical protein
LLDHLFVGKSAHITLHRNDPVHDLPDIQGFKEWFQEIDGTDRFHGVDIDADSRHRLKTIDGTPLK